MPHGRGEGEGRSSITGLCHTLQGNSSLPYVALTKDAAGMEISI